MLPLELKTDIEFVEMKKENQSEIGLFLHWYTIGKEFSCQSSIIYHSGMLNKSRVAVFYKPH